MAMLLNAAGNANQMYMMTDVRQSNIAEYQARQEALDAVRNGNVQHVPEELRGMLAQQRNVEEVRSPSFSAMQEALERQAALSADERTVKMQSNQSAQGDKQAEINRHTLGM